MGCLARRGAERAEGQGPKRAARAGGRYLALGCLTFLLACASAPPANRPPVPSVALPAGVHHVVQKGETVWRLSKRYGVAIETILRANNLDDVTRVPAGARLFIPGGRDRGTAHLPPLLSAGSPGVRRQTETELDFGWPVAGRVTSRFGKRRGKRHDGVDLSAPRGSLIRASESGRVIYSGSGLGAYGNVVIVKHVGRYSTVYAHNRRNRVRKGVFVERGQVIAELGSTGNASGPHVHFEIRRDDRPRDPLRYLPRSISLVRSP